MDDALERLADHPVVEKGARLGYVVSGVLHLLMGLLAVRLANGDPGAEADQSGAFSALANTPFGGILLALAASGLTLLAVSQAAEAFTVGQAKDRAKAGAKALGYLALAAGAVGFLFGARSSSARQAQEATGTLLSLPAGVAVVVAVGVAVVAVGGYHVVKGAGRRFRRDLTEEPPRGILALGVIGYIAKGVALVATGVLFAQAALTHDPSKAQGLDGAVTALLRVPLGQVVVTLIGLGFAAYGVYSFARARWARL